MTHDLSDPKAPSSRQSVIIQPDKSVPGGMRTIRQPFVAEAAKSYTP